ncbi:MAG: preprotein translocase subunit YajC [Christensenellaceae bacterium]|nr:preprotein translocase subunit YajC [Christensenellaceae bacterium]
MDSNFASILMMVAIFAIFIVMMIIPQRKRKKQLQELMESIKPGKMVKTIGGLYGKVVAVKEDLVTIEALPDKVRLVFTKGAIASVEDSDVPEQELERK